MAQGASELVLSAFDCESDLLVGIAEGDSFGSELVEGIVHEAGGNLHVVY